MAGIASGALANAPAQSLRPVLRPGGGGSGAAAPAAAKAAVPAAEALIRAAGLGAGQVGFAVADARTGLMLEAHDGDLGQPPASVTKTVTALYALDVLGPGHRFTTDLIATGPVAGGVLQGDLVLAGGGDPTLDTDMLADMARRLKAAGVSRVSGDFKVWGGALPQLHEIDRDQPDHVGYNPAISGIALNFNRVHFEWKRGANGWVTAMDARSDRYRPEVGVAKMQIVNRDLPVYTYQEKNGAEYWTVASKALGKGGSRWLPVRQPEIYAGEAFRALAAAQGIAMGRPQAARALPAGKALVRQTSVELREVLRDMLKYSNNLTAEMVGLAATRARGGNPGSLRASAQTMNGWAAQALGMRGARLVDHSGLGEASRLTAADLTQALVRAHTEGTLKPILKKIDMRHDNGKVNKTHPIQVFAKTGTLNFVSGLAGYIVARDGTEMAFGDLRRRSEGPRPDQARRLRAAPGGARGWNKRAKQLQ
ncbi:MAG: D-alanyl-D-alanine carboxypeptidase/D-alanyl-D-alanine-endopeptidase [Paracoccaceae bacterium]